MQLLLTICKETIMSKILILSLWVTTALFAVEIPIEEATTKTFGKSVELNAKVIQLSNAKQSIMSLVSGHIEKYYVSPGQKVKSGQKIALIESIMLSKMTADYISEKEQFSALNKNYEATKKLYEKGMTSMQELNLQSIQKNAMSARITTLKSQLATLGIQADLLKEASANYILYAHSDGTVSELLQPLHSVIGEDTAIISIVKDQAFYIKSYLPLEYANLVKTGQKIVVSSGNEDLMSHVTQVLPELDEKTQRIILLSSIDERTDNLYINSYVSSTLYLDAKDEHVAVKKSALSFFKNEWVVFVPKEESHEEEDEHGHGTLDDHDKDEHATHDDHEAEEDNNDDNEHDEHDEDEAAYEARIVEIITQDETYAAVKGLESGEAYVSDKSYYVKSMMLKSSLGEHGH